MSAWDKFSSLDVGVQKAIVWGLVIVSSMVVSCNVLDRVEYTKRYKTLWENGK